MKYANKERDIFDVAYELAISTAKNLAQRAKERKLYESNGDSFLAEAEYWKVYDENFSKILKEEDKRLRN